ncbi:CapA family protein [Gordonia paraffinivorans]|uniref:CapA family protein n=1 Tax=Gordonia paraffinivorans TaxID=175628 RepID=UPI00289B46E5|nr:CapA family protein [Gordonia paraffinivorans]
MLGKSSAVLAAFVVVVVTVCGLTVASSTRPLVAAPSSVDAPIEMAARTPVGEQIVLSFSGDTILGTDDTFAAESGLPAVWERSGRAPDHFFRNVRHLFTADDLTVGNVEVAFTRSREKRYKGEGEVYHFNGDPALAHTLPAGGFDVATVANNHTFDYGQTGFDDTLAALADAGIGVFGTGYEGEGSGYDLILVRKVKGVTFGFVGYQAWTDGPEMAGRIHRDFARLRAAGAQVIIPYFHWGEESEHLPSPVQTNLAHIAVDAGADLVVGTHPHVIQSMEVYRGKLIAYSFGNFAFGGNSNPSDKRALILQTRFTAVDGSVRDVGFRVIPTRVSSTEAFNDYAPTPYRDGEKRDVLGFVNSLSPTLGDGSTTCSCRLCRRRSRPRCPGLPRPDETAGPLAGMPCPGARPRLR